MRKILCIIMILMFSIVGYAASVKDVLAGLQKIKSYQADFTQFTEIEGFGEDEYSGKLYIRSGEVALWNYSKPYRQFYLFDEGEMQFYDSDTKQLIKQRLTPETNVFMRLMLNPKDIEKDFSVKLVGDKLEMSPIKDIGVSKIIFTIKSGIISGISTRDQNGNNTRIELDGIVVNEEIADKTFSPQVPADTEIFSQ